MRKYRSLITAEAIQGNQVALSAEETHYLKHVLRLQIGDSLELLDGHGKTFQGMLRTWKPTATAEILTTGLSSDQGESSLHLTLVIALIKGERFEWAIQKGTELGVQEFIPLLCRYSEVRLKSEEACRSRLSRWEKILQSATRQCRRSVIPCIHPVTDFSHLISRVQGSPSTKQETDPFQWFSLTPSAYRLALLEQGGRSLNLLRDLPKPAKALLWIGPEGGWDPQEEAFLREYCFPLFLGTRILRSDTAAVAATALVQSLWGDLPFP